MADASTGFTFPGTVTTASNLATHTFTNQNNVKLNNSTISNDTGSKFDLTPIGTVSPGDGPELITSNYGFSIPAGSTIVGVEAKIEGYGDSNRVGELAYLTINASSFTGTEKVNDWTTMSTDNTTPTYSVHTYGGTADSWSASLTPTLVNSTNFGWIFMIYDEVSPLGMSVDYMQINVHYDLPPGAIVMMIGA